MTVHTQTLQVYLFLWCLAPHYPPYRVLIRVNLPLRHLEGRLLSECTPVLYTLSYLCVSCIPFLSFRVTSVFSPPMDLRS